MGKLGSLVKCNENYALIWQQQQIKLNYFLSGQTRCHTSMYDIYFCKEKAWGKSNYFSLSTNPLCFRFKCFLSYYLNDAGIPPFLALTFSWTYHILQQSNCIIQPTWLFQAFLYPSLPDHTNSLECIPTEQCPARARGIWSSNFSIMAFSQAMFSGMGREEHKTKLYCLCDTLHFYWQ